MKETWQHLKMVFKVGNEYKYAFILEIVLTFIQIIIGIILPLYLAKQIVLFASNELHQLVLASLAVLGISIINEINNCLIARVCTVFRRGTSKNIQIKLGQEILKVCQKEMEHHGTGTFIERLNQDTDKMSEIFTKGVGYLSGVSMNIGIFIAVFLMNKIVFCFYITVAIILTLFHLLRTHKIGIEEMKLRKQKDKVSSFVGELVRGEKDIKMLSAKQSFMNKLTEEITEKNNCYHSVRKVGIIYNTSIAILIQLFSFLLVLLLIALIKRNSIDAALAVALFTYRTNIMTNFMEKIALLLDECKSFNISCNSVFSIIENKEFAKEKFGKKHLDHIEGNFEFQNVSFSYDQDHPVLKNMSFKVNSGETVAFVGKSGSGKSTVFNLLGKLYDSTDGKITLDGFDINLLDEESIRNNITIISQNPYIFNMSIRDNFRLVKEDITEEEIINALEKACLIDFINQTSKGLDTIIGEGGTNLSGGQKQRLAIA